MSIKKTYAKYKKEALKYKDNEAKMLSSEGLAFSDRIGKLNARNKVSKEFVGFKNYTKQMQELYKRKDSVLLKMKFISWRQITEL
ncbi:MAG: hypothetical protein IKU47_03980 [Oscillospiraceae bacterium]|nr:hypothetical protein [Oscillospiraceae bacterium]